MVRGLEAGAGHDVAFSTCDCPTTGDPAQPQHADSTKLRHRDDCRRDVTMDGFLYVWSGRTQCNACIEYHVA